MFTRLARRALIAAAATAITALPAAASAQSYGYQGGYVPGYGGQTYSAPNYCDRNRQGRTGAGTLIGAGAGAVLGSQLAARGRRTEGSILGGVLGAVVGGAAGRGSSDRCYGYENNGYAYSPHTPAYSNRPYSSGYGYASGYSQPYSYAPSSSYGYSSSYSSGSTYYDDDGYGPYAAAPRRDDRYNSGGGYYDRDDRSRDGCRLAESRIRLPDGRSETRYVRTCLDSSGRYRVVD